MNERDGMMKKILIVDDDAAVTNYLMVFLMQTALFETTVVNDSREVPALLSREAFEVILLDMDMPNVSGLDILRLLRDRGLHVPVIVLTGVADVDLAVRSLKLGAFDYLTKPVEDEHLLEVIDAAISHHNLHHSIEELPRELTRENLTHKDAFERVPTQDPVMIRLLHEAERVAGSSLSVFILGERGTGKEMLARAIHGASPARDRAFVLVDASAQMPEQFPAAFFGQARVWGGDREERPGFLEEAEKGTIYLCEIEHLTRSMQVRLLRVLQTGEYYRENSTQIRKADVRFIVSSSLNLAAEKYQEIFSHDLLYHLMINSLSVPPLRERMGDLPLLIEFFRRQGQSKIPRPVTGFAPAYVELLSKHDYPDNLQELRTIIETSMVNAEGPVVTVEALPPYIRQKIVARAAAGGAGAAS
ncbi:MAG: sigma-54 dependent transcriptional regulator [Candidatus Eisenbacteria bacterium]